MSMLLTALALLAVTVLSVVHHLRTRPMPTKTVKVQDGPPCRRCRTNVPPGSAYCPGCGIAHGLASLKRPKTEELAKALSTKAATSRSRRLLVVGGGDRAIGTAVGLARQPGTTVFLSHRGDRLGQLEEDNRRELEAAVQAGRIKLLLNSRVREIRRGEVILEIDGRKGRLRNDDVIIRLEEDSPSEFVHAADARMGGQGVCLPNREVASAG